MNRYTFRKPPSTDLVSRNLPVRVSETVFPTPLESDDMKLQSAEFCFDKHKVEFIGGSTNFYVDVGGSWELIGERTNEWASRSRGDDGNVMGRAFKPRITDATTLLSKMLKEVPHGNEEQR